MMGWSDDELRDLARRCDTAVLEKVLSGPIEAPTDESKEEVKRVHSAIKEELERRRASSG